MNCSICKQVLNTSDPLTRDCGGDCLLCMAEAGDPDCMPTVVAQVRPLQKRIVAEEKRFAEHLAAWRENNLHHQARIADLEQQLSECKSNLECHERDL